MNIFLNASAFLRVPQDGGRSSNKRNNGDGNAQDPLDDRRTHPEDYDLARKMATHVLDKDEEELQGEQPSQPVTDLQRKRRRSLTS